MQCASVSMYNIILCVPVWVGVWVRVTDLSVFVLTATDTAEKISGSGFHLSLFNETPERKKGLLARQWIS